MHSSLKREVHGIINPSEGLFWRRNTPHGLPAWDPKQGSLSIQPKNPEISVGTSNRTHHFVWSDWNIRDRSGHFGRSDWNFPFHMTKLLSPVQQFCILLTRAINKCAVAWVGSVQPKSTLHWAREISEIPDRKFCWMKALKDDNKSVHSVATHVTKHSLVLSVSPQKKSLKRQWCPKWN